MRSGMRTGPCWLLMLGVLAAEAVLAQVQSVDQQKCLAALAKGTLKVSKTQAGEDRACVQGVAKAKLVGTAEACLVADARGKGARTGAKNLAVEAARCTGGGAPTFGSGGAAAANAAASLAERDLAHDVFGVSLDAGLAGCDADKSSCTCQGKTFAGVDKYFAALGKTHVTCKKKRFKEGAIAGEGDLEDCLADPAEALSVAADTKQKLAKGRSKLASIIDKTCDAPGVSTTSFPGSCDAMAGAPLMECLADRAQCRFCQMVNAAEDTFADCDTFDDAAGNGSCENLSCPASENACITGCTDLDSDESNCGICGMTCGMSETCTSGICL